MNTDAEVIVIGGGPVGTIALALLGRAGITAIGLEKACDVWPSARAVHFDGETMRTLQGLGLAERISEVVIPMKDLEFLDEDDRRLAYAETGAFGDQGWNDDISFHQPDVEKLLRELVNDTPGVELRCGVTVQEVVSSTDVVEVTTLDDKGNPRTYRARWVIAADGGRSEVRRSLGIDSTKYGEDAQWLVVDGDLEDAPGYSTDMVQFFRHSRPALWLRLPGSRVRMEFMLLPGDDPEEMVTADAVERISRGALPVGKFRADRKAVYTFRGRVAERWRHGNIFLAGDAAHQAPPLFGQGLCAGIRDVANLVWKIDQVRREVAPASLLDTYESERKAHATFWVDTAARQAESVQTLDPEVAAGRDAYFRAHPEAAAPPLPPSLGPGLHAGDLDARAGMLGPQPILVDGTRLDDMVGPHFLVAVESGLHAALPVGIRNDLDDDGETVTLLDPLKVDGILGRLGVKAAVIRPDHYVLGVADTAVELENLLRRIPSLDRSTVLTTETR